MSFTPSYNQFFPWTTKSSCCGRLPLSPCPDRDGRRQQWVGGWGRCIIICQCHEIQDGAPGCVRMRARTLHLHTLPYTPTPPHTHTHTHMFSSMHKHTYIQNAGANRKRDVPHGPNIAKTFYTHTHNVGNTHTHSYSWELDFTSAVHTHTHAPLDRKVRTLGVCCGIENRVHVYFFVNKCVFIISNVCQFFFLYCLERILPNSIATEVILWLKKY